MNTITNACRRQDHDISRIVIQATATHPHERIKVDPRVVLVEEGRAIPPGALHDLRHASRVVVQERGEVVHLRRKITGNQHRGWLRTN